MYNALYERAGDRARFHYLEDWAPLFGELRRLLAAEGRVLFSTHHATMDWKLAGPEDYFLKTQFTDVWTKGGTPFEVTYWRRPLSAMSNKIRHGGFVIQSIDEPMPSDMLADIGPAEDRYLRTNPHFLFVTLVPAA